MPAEDAFFIGEETATAAKLRQTRLIHQLGQGPGTWLATVLAVLLGKRLPGTPAQERATVAFARGVLTGLGYDADTHQLSRRRRRFVGVVHVIDMAEPSAVEVVPAGALPRRLS